MQIMEDQKTALIPDDESHWLLKTDCCVCVCVTDRGSEKRENEGGEYKVCNKNVICCVVVVSRFRRPSSSFFSGGRAASGGCLLLNCACNSRKEESA